MLHALYPTFIGFTTTSTSWLSQGLFWLPTFRLTWVHRIVLSTIPSIAPTARSIPLFSNNYCTTSSTLDIPPYLILSRYRVPFGSKGILLLSQEACAARLRSVSATCATRRLAPSYEYLL